MELTDNDKQRIKQEACNQIPHGYQYWPVFIRAAEYATIYEREQQSSAIKELSEFKEAARRQSLELYKLEAERSELKSIVDVLATIVDTPEFGNMWPGTAHSLRTKLNSLKTKP